MNNPEDLTRDAKKFLETLSTVTPMKKEFLLPSLIKALKDGLICSSTELQQLNEDEGEILVRLLDRIDKPDKKSSWCDFQNMPGSLFAYVKDQWVTLQQPLLDVKEIKKSKSVDSTENCSGEKSMSNLGISDRSYERAKALLRQCNLDPNELSQNLIDSVSMAYEDGLLSPQSERTLLEAEEELQELALMTLNSAFRSWEVRGQYPNAAKMWEDLKEKPELLMELATGSQQVQKQIDETEPLTPFKQALDEALHDATNGSSKTDHSDE